jgi:hypothetical protein
MKTRAEKQATDMGLARFHEGLAAAAAHITRMHDAKASDYNNDGQQFWHYAVHGDASWSHEVAKNAMRLVSMVKAEAAGQTSAFEGIDEKILDTMVYCAAWWSARRMERLDQSVVEKTANAVIRASASATPAPVHSSDELPPIVGPSPSR